MRSKQPLAGKHVLVGRSRRQASALSVALRDLGAAVIEIPFIEIRPPQSYEPLDRALNSISEYDWLILTSVNGVDALATRLNHLKIPIGRLSNLQLAAIGPATQRAAEELGLEVAVLPKKYVAESVVEALRGKVKGKRVLLARAKVARDVIPRELCQLGAQVDVVDAYETVLPPQSKARLQSVLTSPAQRPDFITFTSSSTVRNFVELLGGREQVDKIDFREIQFVSIGPVTSQTLHEYGFPAHIQAAEYTIPGLVRAIVASL
jgi:uroporphyrinogen-III synthase